MNVSLIIKQLELMKENKKQFRSETIYAICVFK